MSRRADETGNRFAAKAGSADAGLVVADPVAHFELQHLAFPYAVELERTIQRVGRFLIIIEHEMPAHAGRLYGKVDAQAPARDIDLMCALVADVAVAVIPEPMPVIVKP